MEFYSTSFVFLTDTLSFVFLTDTFTGDVYLTLTPFLNEGSLVRVTLPSSKLILNLDQNGSHQQKRVPARRRSESL
jgi:hypothetical protein